MAVRLRLRRLGRKKRPFYRIVAIDSREKRDGKYLESIGYYNPITNPSELKVDTDRALYWLKQGAQPSDTVRSLLRQKGIMLRWDLIKRGKTEEEIDEEFKKWEISQQEKIKRLEAAKIQAMRNKKEEIEEEEPKAVAEPQPAEEVASEASEEVAEAPEAAPEEKTE